MITEGLSCNYEIQELLWRNLVIAKVYEAMSLGACAVIDYVGVLGQVSFHLLIWLLALL